MKSKELLFWIWLSEALGAGTKSFLKLIELYESPYELFHAEEAEIERIEGLSDRVRASLCDKSLSRATQILEACERLDIGIVTWADAHYPKMLKEIADPPVLLYWRGTFPRFEERLCVGMVGTRRMSAYGLRSAYKMAYELATLGAVVVSGMAAGIDGVSSAAAIAAGGTTVAVLGCGLDVIYPRHHKRLYEEILKSGLLLSEYPPGTRPNGYHFPTRNRIISGLSQATLVVEAGLGSGSLITAKDAILQGRDVYALPANVGSHGAEGTNGLLRDGAHLALNARELVDPYAYLYANTLHYEKLIKVKDRSEADLDFLARMGVIELTRSEKEATLEPREERPIPEKPKERPRKPRKKAAKPKEELAEPATAPASATPDEVISSLSPVQLAILQHMPDDRAIATDALCGLDFPQGEIMAALTFLEIMGLIQKLPGALYKKS
ncbi:MAG: DNA-processing protein DprA [Clostridia bacterium]|nr:DNA-processing protein DprA [Clostridia bacterium]